jgi:hypothetical protein
MITLPHWSRIILVTLLALIFVVLAIFTIEDFIEIIKWDIPLLVTDPFEVFLFQQLYAGALTFCTIDICYSLLKSYPRQKRQVL